MTDTVPVTQADSSSANEFIDGLRGRVLMSDREMVKAELAQFIAGHRLAAEQSRASTAADSEERGVPCERCQGNGEIVTDWDRYRHAEPGDKGDEGTADCPDCGGTGRLTDRISSASTPAVDREKLIEVMSPFGWLGDECVDAIMALFALHPPVMGEVDR